MGKQKNHFEETVDLLRRENESIRGKMVEYEQHNEN